MAGPPPWTGTDKPLDKAFEKAAANAPEGDHELKKITVHVHHNQPGETGPNPIREYTVELGPGG